jgi:hypothetical protein
MLQRSKRRLFLLLVASAVLCGFGKTAVLAANNRPIAGADGPYTVVQGGTLSLSAPGVLANDSDADGDTLTTVLVAGPSQGTLSLGRDGSFTYQASTNYIGEDSFVYVANDGHTVSLRAVAKLKIVSTNALPSVRMVSPQDGAAVSTGNFNVIASVADSDGSVTNVQFVVNDIPFTNVSSSPFYFRMSDTPGGHYRFVAIATDNDGLSTTSAPVEIEVITSAVVSVGSMTLNPQSGLLEQIAVVSNRTADVWTRGVRLSVCNLDGTAHVWNACGIADGTPYLDSTNALAPAGSQAFTIQYSVPDMDEMPTPLFIGNPLPATGPMQPPRITSINPVGPDMIEVKFTSEPGGIYFLQCSEDFVHWQTNPTALVSAATITAVSQPRTTQKCFYRLLRIP